jgi:hypothetical protein
VAAAAAKVEAAAAAAVAAAVERREAAARRETERGWCECSCDVHLCLFMFAELAHANLTITMQLHTTHCRQSYGGAVAARQVARRRVRRHAGRRG